VNNEDRIHERVSLPSPSPVAEQLAEQLAEALRYFLDAGLAEQETAVGKAESALAAYDKAREEAK